MTEIEFQTVLRKHHIKRLVVAYSTGFVPIRVYVYMCVYLCVLTNFVHLLKLKITKQIKNNLKTLYHKLKGNVVLSNGFSYTAFTIKACENEVVSL